MMDTAPLRVLAVDDSDDAAMTLVMLVKQLRASGGRRQGRRSCLAASAAIPARHDVH